MQSRLKWLLAACAIVVAVGATALLWYAHHDVSTSHLWKNFAPSVLQYAIPPVIALFGWTAQQIITSRPKQSTPKQLQKARKALIGRGLEWWRGVPAPAWPGRVLRAGLSPLEITWAGITSDGQRVSGSTSDVKDLAKRFRTARPFRLLIHGPSGSGKSIFARLLMTELLKNIQTGQPIPVFLPVWSWDPETEPMNDWIKRQIGENYPELDGGSSYGPTAVTNLVDQGMILPVLDGLDCLPRRLRKKILDDGGLTSQDRLILTCRTMNFDEFRGFVKIAPETVDQNSAVSFLGAITNYPEYEWDKTKNRPDIAEIMSSSRLVLMASAICGKNGDNPEEFANSLKDAAGSTAGQRLVDMLIPALISDRGERRREYPPYDAIEAEECLRLLAPLGLWESVDLRDPDRQKLVDESGHDPVDENYLKYPGMSCIAWWNLHRGVRWLTERQATLRAVVAGLLTFLITYVIFQAYKPVSYAFYTSGTYGFMVFFGCFFLGRDPAEPDQKAHARERDTEHPSRARRLGRAWAGLHPFVKVTVLITLCAGALLFYRIAKWYHTRPYEFWYQTGIKAGLTDGLYDSLIIIILYVIAKVPRPPRGLWAVGHEQAKRSQARTFALALILGIPFGLAWGLSELWKGQHQSPPSLNPVQLALTGLITGIDFTMGAWLFQWSGTWSRSGRTASPRAAARADLVGALLRPLILGFTFAFAFGISPPFDFTGYYVWVWFVVGVVLGSLETEWPLYFTALMTLRRHRERKLPIRLTQFLECCRVRGLLQSVGQAYQIEDDGLLRQLVRPAGQPGDQTADHQDGQAPGGDAEAVEVSAARG